MAYKSVLVLSDNEAILRGFIDLLDSRPELNIDREFRFACYERNKSLANKLVADRIVEPLNVKRSVKAITAKHDLVISAHCKQIFPAELVDAVKCINIHPGYNPHNRGWYPQVFSILNGRPLGGTIHEIDEELDHGNIIDRERIELRSTDTSLSAYNLVQAVELKLLQRNIDKILAGGFHAYAPEEEGNVNYKKDFGQICEINLDQKVTFRQAIDRLRALTHPPYKNAFFKDPATGKKVFVAISLEEADE